MRNICHAVAFTASAVPNKNFKIKQRIVLIRFCFQAIVYFVFLCLSLSFGNLLKFANGKTHCTELTECVFETFALNTRSQIVQWYSLIVVHKPLALYSNRILQMNSTWQNLCKSLFLSTSSRTRCALQELCVYCFSAFNYWFWQTQERARSRFDSARFCFSLNVTHCYFQISSVCQSAPFRSRRIIFAQTNWTQN